MPLSEKLLRHQSSDRTRAEEIREVKRVVTETAKINAQESEAITRAREESKFDAQVNLVDDVATKERSAIYRHERRALKKMAGGEYTAEQWQGVLAKYGSACLRCGDTENLTVDHVRPVHLGGSSDISNLQPLCRSCNSWKGTKIIDFRK